ncbi:MAG: ABC transporter ATP-binding protein, partial [Trueperaceae bacterium]|nr:ABC transporter ATP-binding protein [Trueperaceae bacterium]
MIEARGVRPPPKAPEATAPISLRQQLRDLRATLGLVFSASRASTVGLVALSVVQALMPAANLWVAKLLLDAVAAAIGGEFGSPAEALSRMLTLLLVQVGLTAVTSALSTFQRSTQELLGDSLQNRISRLILAKASQLEMAQFEDPKSYDALQNAYR